MQDRNGRFSGWLVTPSDEDVYCLLDEASVLIATAEPAALRQRQTR